MSVVDTMPAPSCCECNREVSQDEVECQKCIRSALEEREAEGYDAGYNAAEQNSRFSVDELRGWLEKQLFKPGAAPTREQVEFVEQAIEDLR